MNPLYTPGFSSPVTKPTKSEHTKAAWVAGTLMLLTLCGLAQDEEMTLIMGRFEGTRIPGEIKIVSIDAPRPSSPDLKVLLENYLQ